MSENFNGKRMQAKLMPKIYAIITFITEGLVKQVVRNYYYYFQMKLCISINNNKDTDNFVIVRATKKIQKN